MASDADAFSPAPGAPECQKYWWRTSRVDVICPIPLIEIRVRILPKICGGRGVWIRLSNLEDLKLYIDTFIDISVPWLGTWLIMCVQNYQHFIEMTSNMTYTVALGVGLKCPRKIHFNTQWGALCVEMGFTWTFLGIKMPQWNWNLSPFQQVLVVF